VTPPKTHRMAVDGFMLEGPAGGVLVLVTCPTCRLHARIVAGTAESAEGLANVIVQAHREAEQPVRQAVS
jgi:hypothetical protein